MNCKYSDSLTLNSDAFKIIWIFIFDLYLHEKLPHAISGFHYSFPLTLVDIHSSVSTFLFPVGYHIRYRVLYCGVPQNNGSGKLSHGTPPS